MMKFYLLILCVHLSLSVSVFSQELPSERSTLLSNGMRVITRQRHTTQAAAIDLWVQAGAHEEFAKESGAAHFLEHVLFKGTRNNTFGETDFKMECLGGTLNAATGPDFAHFYTTIPSHNLKLAMALLADIVRNATLPLKEIEHERSVILNELALHQADPSAGIADLVYAEAYPYHPYRKSYGGSLKEISLCERSSLISFYKRNYQPSRCVLSIAGDIDPEAAANAANSIFGDWKSENKAAEHKRDHKSNFELSERMIITGSSLDNHARLGMGFFTPPASDKKSSTAVKIIEALLGNSDEYGRFNRTELHDAHTEIRTSPRWDTSLLIILARVKSNQSEDLIMPAAILTKLSSLRIHILSILESLKSDPPSSDELNSAKVRVLTQLQHDTETTAGLARSIGFAEICEGVTIYELKKEIIDLTPSDIQRYASRFLTVNQSVQIQQIPSQISERR